MHSATKNLNNKNNINIDKMRIEELDPLNID